MARSDWPLANSSHGGPGAGGVIPDTAWHLVGESGEPPFEDPAGADWVNAGGGEQVLQFQRDELGWVHVRGCVSKSDAPTGSFGSLIFRLPLLYRPSGTALDVGTGLGQAALNPYHVASSSMPLTARMFIWTNESTEAFRGQCVWFGPTSLAIDQLWLSFDYLAEI